MSRLYNILNKLIDTVISLSNTVTSIDDYVTEKGVKGRWQYTKYNSGKVEAWCNNLSFGDKTSNVWVAPIRYVDVTGAIPAGIFKSAPTLTITSSTNQWWVNNANATSATAFTSRLCTLASGSNATYVNVYAVSQ